MALPAQPGAPTPTPSPRPVSEGYVSPADYLANEVTKLVAMNQNQTVSLSAVTAYVTGIRDVLVDAEK